MIELHRERHGADKRNTCSIRALRIINPFIDELINGEKNNQQLLGIIFNPK